MLDKKIYVERRRALLEKMKGESGVALFLGNVESPAQYLDNCYKWRQDSNWLYFWGIDSPRFAAIIDLETGEETIFADDFTLDDIIWTGPMPSVASLAAEVGVNRTAPYGALAQALKGRKIHFLPVSRYYNAIKLAKLTGLNPEDHFRAGKSGCPAASEPLVKAVIEMRLVKSADEIALIDEACNLGYEMHTVARKGIRPGRIEQEIVGDMEAVAQGKGWGMSFPVILTQHGEIFHCHSHALPIESGKLVVVDAGVESNEHYASDFTRTYPASGKFTTRQRDIYDIVYDCNALAYSIAKPGISYREVHLAAAKLMLQRLSDLELVRGDVDEMLAAGTAGLFMPHGLGHNMGMDVHDMEDLGENLVGYDSDQKRSEQLGLGSLRMARKLVPGNVLTDEPGIYFIPALIEQWKAEKKPFVNYARLEEYYDFGGIRIEDDLLITSDGVRRLGDKRLPASSAEVEQAMTEDKI